MTRDSDSTNALEEFVENGDWTWPLDAVREHPWDLVSQLGTHAAAAAAGAFVAVLVLQQPSMAYCAGPSVGSMTQHCQTVGGLAMTLQKAAGGVLLAGITAAVVGDYFHESG